MRSVDLSTLPLLAQGEPGCRDIDSLTVHACKVILAACRAPLRRAGRGWYGAGRQFPIHRRTVNALIERGILYRCDLNLARITKRGKWCARTICSEITGKSFATVTEEETNDAVPVDLLARDHVRRAGNVA